MRMKMLCGGLVIFLMAAMNFTSCGNSDDNLVNDGNSYNNRKVDERFWGEWRYKSFPDYITSWNIQITETEFKRYEGGVIDWYTFPAWSEDNILFVHDDSYLGADFKFELNNEGELVFMDSPPQFGSPFSGHSPGNPTLIKKPE